MDRVESAPFGDVGKEREGERQQPVPDESQPRDRERETRSGAEVHREHRDREDGERRPRGVGEQLVLHPAADGAQRLGGLPAAHVHEQQADHDH